MGLFGSLNWNGMVWMSIPGWYGSRTPYRFQIVWFNPVIDSMSISTVWFTFGMDYASSFYFHIIVPAICIKKDINSYKKKRHNFFFKKKTEIEKKNTGIEKKNDSHCRQRRRQREDGVQRRRDVQ